MGGSFDFILLLEEFKGRAVEVALLEDCREDGWDDGDDDDPALLLLLLLLLVLLLLLSGGVFELDREFIVYNFIEDEGLEGELCRGREEVDKLLLLSEFKSTFDFDCKGSVCNFIGLEGGRCSGREESDWDFIANEVAWPFLRDVEGETGGNC